MAAATLGAKRVFIVDDSEVVRERLTEQITDVPGLELVGYADSASAAIRLIRQLTPDAVILDLGLPDASGLVVLEQVKRLTPAPLVVVLTNYPHEEYRRQCLALGADSFLDKSSEFYQVRAALAGQLRASGPLTTTIDDTLLRAAVDAAANGLVLLDAAGVIRLANRQAETIFGYGPGELLGQALGLLLPERFRQMHEHHHDFFLAHPGPRQMGVGRELWGMRKDGQEVPVEIGLSAIAHASETYVLASVVDITDRRRAEGRLRWLSLAVDQGPTSIAMTDVAGNIEYVNAKFSEVTGYTLDDVRGKNPRVLKSGKTPPDVYRDLWATITAGRPWSGEILNKKKDGTEYWDAMWVYPIREPGGPVSRYLALKEDITERKSAEDALRASEARARTLFETVNLIVLGLDANGTVDYVNPFFLKLGGYDRAEVLGEAWSRFLPEKQRPAMDTVFRELLEHNSHAHHENAIVTKAGEERMIAWNNTVLRDTDGRAIGTLSIGEDITEHQRLEAQYRQAQKMEAVGRLAGGVAHDFNNVLTAVFGYVDFLREELPRDSAAQQDIAEVRKAAERAASLTRQLLAFSRQQVLEPVVLGPNDLILDFEKMLRRVIGEDVELRLALAQDVGNVRADPGQLQQVIMNLVVNARDAMPQGGKLIVETANADLTEQYAELHQPVVPGPYIMLAVSDTGTGMTPEVKARIFEPFFTTKEKGKGTGLGLSTVYGIVKQSGGYIWAYSEPGRGTTFKIYLPRVDAPAAPLTQPKEAGSVAGTETILLAEDDAMLRPLAKNVLERLGYTVLDAANAGEALALAATHAGSLDLLVADVVMPGVSGRELARRLADTRPDTKVLYVSGYTDDAIVHHGMLEPGLNFLQKPFTPTVLARKVRDVLDAK